MSTCTQEVPRTDTGRRPLLWPDLVEAVVETDDGSPWSDSEFFTLNHGHVTALVIDDDADTRDLITSILERDGLSVIQAADGRSALAAAAEHDISVVLLDLMLPDEDGHTICQILRDRDPAHTIPVVVLTSRTDVHAEVESALRGADAHLVKPVTRSQLVQRLRDVL